MRRTISDLLYRDDASASQPASQPMGSAMHVYPPANKFINFIVNVIELPDIYPWPGLFGYAIYQ